MIDFEHVGVSYADATAPVLTDVCVHIPEGELCLVVGTTGAGKSTLLGCVNGLVPHFTGGTLTGRVLVAGRDTRTHRPRELADVVGVVGQNPLASFVTDTVEDELAYTMESLGLAPEVMRRRVEDTLDLLGIAPLRARSVASLSAGQAQRVAIGAVLTAQPAVLVLDEPTSALDPGAAEEVLAAIQRLVHDLGLTVLMAEHRLERVIQYADSALWLPGDGAPAQYGTAAQIMSRTPVAPPIVQLGRALGWDPLPLSIRDARRRGTGLRDRLPAQPRERDRAVAHTEAAPVSARLDAVSVRYGALTALREASLAVTSGQIMALMGRNGSGKSTLLRTLAGLIRPAAGRVAVGGADPRNLHGRALTRHLGMVPHQPGDLLYAMTVAEECAQADREAGAPPGSTAALLHRLTGDVDADRHPRDLSEGQRLCLALAVILTSAPPLLLLDEPTRGLDYPAKHRLAEILLDLAARGHAVLVATHDVELAAQIADRVVVLADGDIVADGTSRQVVLQTPLFAPQLAKILAPLPYLTITDVLVELGIPDGDEVDEVIGGTTETGGIDGTTGTATGEIGDRSGAEAVR